MRARVGWVAAVCTLAFAAPAQAQDPYIYLGAATDGDAPYLRVAIPAGGGTAEVHRCPGGGECDAQPLPSSSEQRYATVLVTADLSSAQPGDQFEARLIKDDEVVATDRTLTWNGPVSNRQLAAVTGALRVGGTVAVAPSVWDGGWAQPWARSVERFIACRDVNATDGCWKLGPDTTLTLEPRWEGYYLFVTSYFESGNLGRAAAEVAVPFPVDAPDRNRMPVVSGAYGPVAAVVTPPAPQIAQTKPAAPPSAMLRSRALRRDGKLSLGSVTCPARCTVKLTVSGGGKTLRRTLTLTGKKALTIPRRHGRLKVTVAVDGKPLASRRMRAS